MTNFYRKGYFTISERIEIDINVEDIISHLENFTTDSLLDLKDQIDEELKNRKVGTKNEKLSLPAQMFINNLNLIVNNYYKLSNEDIEYLEKLSKL